MRARNLDKSVSAFTKIVTCPDCRGTGIVTDISTYAVDFSRCHRCNGVGYERVPITNLDFILSLNSPNAMAKFLVDWCQEKAWRKDIGAVESWLSEPRYENKKSLTPETYHLIDSIITKAMEESHYVEKTEDTREA